MSGLSTSQSRRGSLHLTVRVATAPPLSSRIHWAVGTGNALGLCLRSRRRPLKESFDVDVI